MNLNDFDNLAALESQIGYSFKDTQYLMRALTHKSACFVGARVIPVESTLEHKQYWNETLEFLGDSVLSLAISDHLFRNANQFNEGTLSKVRAALVNTESLVQVAKDWSLVGSLKIGKSVAKDLAKDALPEGILADAVEAVFAAIYLDSNDFLLTQSIVVKTFESQLGVDWVELANQDAKTKLQELAQLKWQKTPTYNVEGQNGPDHNPTFTVSISIDGKIIAQGDGQNKKLASRAAATIALELLNSSDSFIKSTPPISSNPKGDITL